MTSTKQMHDLVMSRKGNEAFGFRIIGGKDEGQTFKVEKVLTGYPAYDAGMKRHDFLVSVKGKDVFDFNHAQLVTMIKNSGERLEVTIERGTWIVPNFEEIWPSGRKKDTAKNPETGMEYYNHAMNSGIPGERNKDFTTVGKPKVTVNQYDNPIDCYSEETIEEMTESSATWKKTDDQVQATRPDPNKFNPEASAVLAVIKDHDKGISFAK